MKTRMNRPLSVLLAAVMLLSLLPTAALAAKPLLTVESVTVESDRTKPILGETAVTATADIRIKTPSDERLRINPDRNARYWKYSADGKTDWITYYPDASQTAKFIPGYWQCVLGFWLDNSNEDRTDYAVFGDPCVVTVNGVGWSCTTNETGSLISATSPVFVLDSDGDLLTEVSAISATSANFPTLFTSGQAPAALSSFSFSTNTAVAASIDQSTGVWQVKDGDTWRDLASGETCVPAGAYRLKATLKLSRSSQLITLARDVTLTVDGTEWTVDHDTMRNRGSKTASVTVYSHTVYAAKATCKVTFYDVNDPNPDTCTQTVKADGGEYTLPACPFSPANDTLMFDYWGYEDIYGNDLKKQPGETVLILDDTTIYAYWTGKPGVAKVIFDAALSEPYQYGMPAGAVSVSLEDGQHVSLVGSGYGTAYWLECGGTKLDAAEALSTSKAYTLVINFRLEDGYLPYFSHQTGQLNCPAFGELKTATPVDQDDGSYLVRFSLPSIQGTPISADNVTFTLSGYERGERVSAITPAVSTAGVSLVGSGYGPWSDDSAYLIYQDSNEAYVYYDPIYSVTAVFEASTNYYLDILFAPEDGTVLPDSFWSDGTLIKEKFVLSGIEGAEVIEATPRSIGYRVRFKLPQLGNDPIGAARIILSGYEAGTAAWDVVVTYSDNLAASIFTPHEDYLIRYWFYDADNVHRDGVDDYQIPENSLGAGVTLKTGDVHSFAIRLYPATGYDMSGMMPSDLVLSTPWGDCQADRASVKKGAGEFYWATFTLPAIGNTKPSYAVMLDPGIGTGTAFYNMVYHDGVSDTLSYTLPKLSNVAFAAPEGMIFKAWSVNGAEMQPDTKITVTDFTTVTALWEPAPEEVSAVTLQIPSVPAAGAVLDTAGIHKFSAAESAPYEVIGSVSWSDVTESRDTPTTIHDGDQFQPGKTYRCLLRVKLKDSRDSFSASADDITVTLEGVADGYTVENVKIVGIVLECHIYFTCPPISGSIVKNGSSARAVLTVTPLSDAAALLIAARYSGAQLLEVQVLPVTESGTFTTNPFAHTAGNTYRAFLVEKGSCLPQWTALNLTE